jgi:amidohydrolase
VSSIAEKVVQKVNVVGSEYRTMIGEDFSEFSLRVPSAFYFIGTGNPEKETDYPHHHPRFNIDEEALRIGLEMHIRTALEYLNAI